MTPAGFDTRRRSLGLTIAETAALCRAPEVAVQRWQEGVSSTPEDAIETLDRLEVTMAHAAERIAKKALTLDRHGPLTLLRHRTQGDIDLTNSKIPLGAHAMMIAWGAQAMQAEGLIPEIAWAETAN